MNARHFSDRHFNKKEIFVLKPTVRYDRIHKIAFSSTLLWQWLIFVKNLISLFPHMLYTFVVSSQMVKKNSDTSIFFHHPPPPPEVFENEVD
jgi:hypothetical protein